MVDRADSREDGQLIAPVPRFVGRARELAVLAETLGTPTALVLLEGEAGIGKSRLVQALVETGSYRMLVASAPPYRQPYTLGSVVDAVRQAVVEVAGLGLSPLAGALRPLFPEWAADLPPALEPAEDQLAARHRLFRALAELLSKLRVDVLVTEDVHWSDEATLEFLLFLAAQRELPMAMLLTYRPEDVAAGSLLPRLSSRSPTGRTVHRVSLGPLDVAGTAELVSSMLADGQVSAAFATFLHERTDGVPLAIEESVRLLRERADLVHRRGEWVRRSLDDIHVPPTIRDAVLERVRRLAADPRAVLRAAAVLAEPSRPDALLATAGLPADGTDWWAALDSRLLQGDAAGLIGFRHALAARAVYEAIPAGELRALHTRARRYLEGQAPPPAAALARHCRAAGDTARWCRYAELAAAAALRAGDDAGAVALLFELLSGADLGADTVLHLVEQLPLAVLDGARVADLTRILRHAIDAGTLDRPGTARVRYTLGVILDMMGEHDASRAELKAAIPDLPFGSSQSVQAMLLLGWARGTSWPRDAHLYWLRRAAEATRQLPPADRYRMDTQRAVGLLQLGDDEGWTVAAGVPDATETLEQRQVTMLHGLNVGDSEMRWGRYRDARRHLDQVVELAQAHRYERLGDVGRSTRAHLDLYEGRWSGLAELAAGLADADDQQPVARLESALVAALARGLTGARTAAEPALLAVLDELRERGAVDGMGEPAGMLARWWLADGRVADALRVTEEPVRLLAHKQVWLWAIDVVPARVDALVAADRGESAARLVAEYEAGTAGLAAPTVRASLALSRAFLAAGGSAPPAAVAALFAEAAAAWRALPRPYEALLAGERQARWLLAAGDRQAALTLLGTVLRELTELGAATDADRVAQIMREHGAPAAVWRGGTRGYGDQLSPRELDVVRLVIAGRTNREIAATLHRSPKTVGTQLGSAMRKLKVATRTSLAVAALAAGVTAAD
ncbi:ATP-binding protein [Actinocatenispora sera]|uniref:LuxR family transcriptional regulator n=1 Tax=Actinocatenispora sera TaxID=390989 RepID=A0A810KY76_9ACTN|nr:AAA family ATPase [Actinocatenispora sera]BCJ27382.1 LuxR family transcriptional regulator [Actinocatenispora sera]